jgi:AcrR family transcriptional regulator
VVKRSYDLGSRAEAMAATRERILEEAEALFSPRFFDEVTIADVARAAGVSSQTVVNHFGSKERLYRAGVVERVGPRIEAVRARAVAGDLDSIVDVVCADYEQTGDGTMRLIATAARLEELAEIVRHGRASHRAFVERVFAPWVDPASSAERERLLVLLTVVVDVRTWSSLRRAEGLSADRTREALRDLLRPLLDQVPITG